MGNIIGVITLLATIIVPIVIYLISRNKKELSYEVSSSTLLAENQEFRDKLKIYIDEKEITSDIYLVLLKIVNSGNIPIREEDFSEDINVHLEGELLQAELKEKLPNNLTVKLDKEMSYFSLLIVKPLLLNKGDEFTLKILSTKSEKGITINSRIVGVKQIEKYKTPVFTTFDIVALIFMGVALTISFYFSGINKWYSSFTFGIALGSFVVILKQFWSIFKNLAKRNRQSKIT